MAQSPPRSARPELYSVRQELGSRGIGGFNAGILIVRERSTWQKQVEKRLKASDIRSGQAQKERDIMARLKHRNIVLIYHSFIDLRLGVGSLWLEYCDKGSLRDMIVEHQNMGNLPVAEKTVWRILYELSKAVRYLHYGPEDGYPSTGGAWRSILHCDLTPNNVFLKHEPRARLGFVVKLGDFGAAQMLRPLQFSTRNTIAAPSFRVPEAPDSYSRFSDVWGVGATIYCLCRLVQDFPRYPIQLPYSARLNSLLLKCRLTNPGDRYSSFDLPDIVDREYWRWHTECQLGF